MTVRAVLDSPSIQAGMPEVVAGRSGLDRAVRWVHVSEVRDVSGLLQGEELVLSTGLAIGGADDDARDHLQDLVDAGASGLVLELSTRLPHVPPSMLSVADRAGFPVIVLHERIRFVSVTEQIHREIVAAQYEDLRRAQQVHEAFTALSLEGASANTIVKTASTIAGASVVLEDLSRHVLAHAAVRESDAELLRDWHLRSRLVPAQAETALCGDDDWLTTPVGLQGQVWARLVIPQPGAGPARLAMLLERAAQALQIGRMVERDRLGVEFQARSGFLNDLLRGGIETEADAVARARALGLERGRSFVPVVVHSPEDDPGDPLRVQRQGQRLVESVSDAVRAARVSALVATMEPGTVGLLLSVPAGGDERKAVERLAEAIHARVAREPGRPRPTIGVEDGSASLLDCGTGLRRAQHVSRAARTSTGPVKPYYRHADVRLLGLMTLLREDPRVQAFTESELQRLLVHDARHGDGMLDLLRQFLALGGNKSTLARRLDRSRPAVYKQLERLERLLGVPLDDAASRTSLSVALLAYDQSLSQN